MLSRFLPHRADNSYQGHKAALWIFSLVLLILAAMSMNSIFNGHFVAVNADGLPLDSYTPAGAQAVVSFYAIWGVTQFVIVLIGIISLVRYRALVPLMSLLLLLEQIFLRVVHYYLPIEKPKGAPALFFIVILLALMVMGVILSAWPHRHQVTSS